MKTLDVTAAMLLVIGGLNWGLTTFRTYANSTMLNYVICSPLKSKSSRDCPR
jgi:hypothetical protein